MIPAHTVLFAAPDDVLAESEARAYIARYNLNAEYVKMARRSGMLIVEARKDLELNERGQHLATDTTRDT